LDLENSTQNISIKLGVAFISSNSSVTIGGYLIYRRRIKYIKEVKNKLSNILSFDLKNFSSYNCTIQSVMIKVLFHISKKIIETGITQNIKLNVIV